MPREPLPVARAKALIAAALPQPGREIVAIGEAVGRVLAEPCLAGSDVPPCDRATLDGYALLTADTVGASDYTPISLMLRHPSDCAALPCGGAVLVTCGQRLPDGADAVVPFEAASRVGGMVEVSTQVAPGAGVGRRGTELAAGSAVLAQDSRLRAQDVGLLVALGVTHVCVLRRLRAGLVVVGPKSGDVDSLTPMLRALLARDGAIAQAYSPAGREREAVEEAILRAAGASDLLLIAGGSGDGPDDEAPQAAADAGGVRVFHGVALRPGGSAGLWRMGEMPALLLPGAPLACMVAYDVLAARSLRQADDADAHLDATLDRKIVSGIGCTEVVRVTVNGGRVTPLGPADAGGLASIVRADGFVLVPASSEGAALGATVRVHLYGSAREAGS